MSFAQIVAQNIAFFKDTSIGGWVAPCILSIAQHAHKVIEVNYHDDIRKPCWIVLSTPDRRGLLFLVEKNRGDFRCGQFEVIETTEEFKRFKDWELVKARKMSRATFRSLYLKAA